jgi:hypothetical protein
MQRLKTAGILAKLQGLYVLAADTQEQALVNLANPAAPLVVNGTPSFTQWAGITFPTIADFLGTGVAPSTLNQDSVMVACWTKPTYSSSATTNNMGSTDSGGTVGVALTASSAKVPSFVSMSTSTASTTTSDQEGMQAFNRTGSGANDLWHDSVKTDALTQASTSAAAVTGEITIGKVNGQTTTCKQAILAAAFGASLTDAQMQTLYAAVMDYTEKVQFGDFDVTPAGVGPTVLTVDHIIYGVTEASMGAAIQMGRDGESFAVIGGWRDGEISIGGMPTNGLGWTDWDGSYASMPGLAKTYFSKARTLAGLPLNGFPTASRFLTRALRGMCDPARAGGVAVPIYFSTGIASITKSGTIGHTVVTNDGRTIVCKYGADGSYEADAQVLLADTYVGREAAGTGAESVNGNQGVRNSLRVSPYVTQDVPGSGLLPYVEVDTTAQGAADNRVQSPNYRCTLTNSAARRFRLPTTPPSDYTAQKYVLLDRMYTSTQPGWTQPNGLAEIVKPDSLGDTVFDFNSRGFFSIDGIAYGLGTLYGAAQNNAEREVIVKRIENHYLGFFYHLQYGSTTPAIVNGPARASMLNYGFDTRHYLDPLPNDQLHRMSVFYLREMRRWVGEFKLDANDYVAVDGTVPRSTKTVVDTDYQMDKHSCRYTLNTTTTPHSITAEGGLGITTGGTDGFVPIPYEVALPKRAQCTNWCSIWGVSMTSLAISAFRMSPHAINLGQAMAIAMRIARIKNIALHDVDYEVDLRPAILAIPDQTPLLKQVN